MPGMIAPSMDVRCSFDASDDKTPRMFALLTDAGFPKYNWFNSTTKTWMKKGNWDQYDSPMLKICHLTAHTVFGVHLVAGLMMAVQRDGGRDVKPPMEGWFFRDIVTVNQNYWAVACDPRSSQTKLMWSVATDNLSHLNWQEMHPWSRDVEIGTVVPVASPTGYDVLIGSWERYFFSSLVCHALFPISVSSLWIGVTVSGSYSVCQ